MPTTIDRTSMWGKVHTILLEYCDTSPEKITDDSLLHDELGISSAYITQVIFDIEQEFGISFGSRYGASDLAELLPQIATAGKLCDFTMARLCEKEQVA